MATRKLTSTQRQAMVDDIRSGCDSGRMRPGDMVPTVRELQATYSLSARVVHDELRKLVDAGVLVTKPRVGVFVADREATNPDSYLMVAPRDPGRHVRPDMLARVRDAFEDEITRLGGASVALLIDDESPLTRGRLPDVAGVFAAAAGDRGEVWGLIDQSVPRARWNTYPLDRSEGMVVDTVAPDFVGAGRRATEHLARRGHRRIGFLGMHAEPDAQPQPDHWSALCEEGWREVLGENGEDPANLTFRPDHPAGDRSEQTGLASEVARGLVARRDVTAVVCANSSATAGIVEALVAAGVPADSWPTLVTIGIADAPVSALTTTIRIPHEGIGRTAARVLWKRRHDELAGPGQHHLVPMPIVRRADHGYAWFETVDTPHPAEFRNS